MRKSGENNPYFVSDIYVLFLDRENKEYTKRLVEKQHPENSKIGQKNFFFLEKPERNSKQSLKKSFVFIECKLVITEKENTSNFYWHPQF